MNEIEVLAKQIDDNNGKFYLGAKDKAILQK